MDTDECYEPLSSDLIPTLHTHIHPHYTNSDVLYLPPLDKPSTFNLLMFDRLTSKSPPHSQPLFVDHNLIILHIHATSISIGSANLIPKVDQIAQDPEPGQL
jgi:hypothetical protein